MDKEVSETLLLCYWELGTYGSTYLDDEDALIVGTEFIGHSELFNFAMSYGGPAGTVQLLCNELNGRCLGAVYREVARLFGRTLSAFPENFAPRLIADMAYLHFTDPEACMVQKVARRMLEEVGEIPQLIVERIQFNSCCRKGRTLN